MRPDLTADKCDVATQTASETAAGVAPAADGQADQPSSRDLVTHKPQAALLYVALLGTKDEAEEEIKKLLAQINYDHANFPTELVFRIHSDKGGEFMSEKFIKWCADKGIHKTTTAGYDPNNNPAEVSVGMIKRRSRYLLGGNRLSTTWWGMASLAAAQLYRADAGLEEYPRIPFGTRVMVVKDPKPRNAFVLQAEPATLFGPCENISGSSWVYQNTKVVAKTNFHPQGLTDHDLNW